jgi:hypothetical protein
MKPAVTTLPSRITKLDNGEFRFHYDGQTVQVSASRPPRKLPRGQAQYIRSFVKELRRA